jgi:hypothetical protein
MKSMKSLRYYSLALCSLMIVAVSCKKSSNNSNPSSLKSGTMTANVNGKPSTFTIIADSTGGDLRIDGSGVIAGTTDTLTFVIQYDAYSANWINQYKGSFSDTANLYTGNDVSISVGYENTSSNLANFWDNAAQSLLIGNIDAIGGGNVTGTVSGTIYLSNVFGAGSNVGTYPDSLIITQGEFNAQFQ